MRWGVLRAATVRFLVGLLLAGAAVPVRAQDAPWPDQARAAVDLLDRQWGKPGEWTGAGGWQRFVIVDALIDYERRTGDLRWRPAIAAAVRNRNALALNDDALWAVLASVHAWRLEGDPELLDYAAATFGRVVSTYWDDRCGGGLWWDPARSYKNAITNELLIYASSQLYLATGQQAYRAWALRGWSWFAQSSMIDANGLVNDGLDGACRNNGQPRFTYNQGVLIGGLNDLTRITGDARYRALAVKTALATAHGLTTPEGILREPIPMVGVDGLMFKGIFAYHLGHLLEDMPDGPERTELLAWARLNAAAAWSTSAGGTRAIDADWSGVPTATGAATQASGIAMLVAAMDRPVSLPATAPAGTSVAQAAH